MPTIRDIVKEEIQKHIKTPTFLETIGQQLIMQSHITNAVRSQLPNALLQNSGLVSQFVQIHMPSVLNQQHYFLAAIQQQKDDLKKMSDKQLETYNKTESDMLNRLNNKVDVLVHRSIKDVSNKNYVVTEMKKNIRQDIIQDINHDINNRIISSCAVTGVLSAGAGCLLSYLCRSHL